MQSTAHENRRHQLDLRLLEIEDLKCALDTKSHELERVETEKERIAAEKSIVARTVADLEGDLRRVKHDAEAFGRDLKLLRAEKDKAEARYKEEVVKAEKTKKQVHAQMKVLGEQAESYKERLNLAREELQNHTCDA